MEQRPLLPRADREHAELREEEVDRRVDEARRVSRASRDVGELGRVDEPREERQAERDREQYVDTTHDPDARRLEHMLREVATLVAQRGRVERALWRQRVALDPSRADTAQRPTTPRHTHKSET